jgi:hypothetical protein
LEAFRTNVKSYEHTGDQLPGIHLVEPSVKEDLLFSRW